MERVVDEVKEHGGNLNIRQRQLFRQLDVVLKPHARLVTLALLGLQPRGDRHVVAVHRARLGRNVQPLPQVCTGVSGLALVQRLACAGKLLVNGASHLTGKRLLALGSDAVALERPLKLHADIGGVGGLGALQRREQVLHNAGVDDGNAHRGG